MSSVNAFHFPSYFIVVFPEEAEQALSAHLAKVRQVRYAGAYSFKYAARPGTPAADMQETVTATLIGERLAWLQELIDRAGLSTGQGIGQREFHHAKVARPRNGSQRTWRSTIQLHRFHRRLRQAF